MANVVYDDACVFFLFQVALNGMQKTKFCVDLEIVVVVGYIVDGIVGVWSEWDECYTVPS